MTRCSSRPARRAYAVTTTLLVASVLLVPMVELGPAKSAVTNLIYTHRVAGAPVASLVAGRHFEFQVKPTHRRRVTSRRVARRTAEPRITSEPTSVATTAGQVVSFRASASGVPSPKVRWKRRRAGTTAFAVISGATSSTYSFIAQRSQSADAFEAVFSNSAGSVTSRAATLTVPASLVAPSISMQPSAISVTAGSLASFSASASGSPMPSVQWMVSSDGGTTFSAIAGANSPTYSLTAQVAQGGTRYVAVFSNSVGSATTNSVPLTVTAASSAPVIITQPVSVTATSGSLVSFTAGASGTPTPNVQWRYSTDGVNWIAIAGAIAPTLSFTAQSAMSGDRYDAMFANASGVVTTNGVTLTVSVATSAPIITTEPVSATAAAGQVISFTAAASGVPAPSVQWSYSADGTTWTAISGATLQTYSFIAQSTENDYRYEATFTNVAGLAVTTPAVLTVTPGTVPVVTTEPVSVTTTPGTVATFTAVASGSPAPSVQWELSTNGTSWIAINGAISTAYAFNVTSSENGDLYEAVFTNALGSATTSSAILTVTATPNASSSNWSGYADYGSTFTGVSGSWTVPTLTCTSSATTYSSHWIGIDGAGSSTVEQVGTEADCVGMTPVYDAWFEMYGDTAVNGGFEVQLGSGDPVAPLDPISARVSVVNNLWTLSISDGSLSHGWSFSTTANFAAAQSSAEWVVERPEICSSTCALASLSDFGSVTFTSSTVTTAAGTAAISAFPYYGIEMLNGTVADALPSGLVANGTGFSDTWLHS